MRNINKFAVYLCVILGAVMLSLFFKLNALYLFFILVGAIVYFLYRNKKEKSRNFLIALILLVVISRLVLSLFVLNARKGELAQDEGLYSKKALLKVYELKGISNSNELFDKFFNDYDMLDRSYGYNGYTYALTAFYYIFGYQTQGARLINIFFNILTLLLIFYLARELFGEAAARMSSVIFAFFPSIMIWSVMLGVDTLIIFGVTLYMISLMKLLGEIRLKWAALLAFSILIVMSAREYLAPVLAAGICFSFLYKFFVFIKPSKRSVITGLVFLMIVFALFAPFRHPISEKFSDAMRVLIDQQRGFAWIDDSGYLIYPAHCYVDLRCGFMDIVTAYAKGAGYVLFSPFPWRIDSKLQLMAYPQVVFWYFMIPFVIYGIYTGFRRKSLVIMPMLLYVFFTFSVLALGEGNVGALFRHKDMVMPFMIICFSGGLCEFYAVKLKDVFTKDEKGKTA